AGVRVFIEAGPGRVLTHLVGSILASQPHHAVAIDTPRKPGVPALLLALAELATVGVPVDPSPLFRDRDAELVPIRAPELPRRPNWLVNGHRVTTIDGHPVPGGLRPTRRLAAPPATPEEGRDAVVRDYLRTTREIITAQRDIMLGYLADTPTRVLGTDR